MFLSQELYLVSQLLIVEFLLLLESFQAQTQVLFILSSSLLKLSQLLALLRHLLVLL